LPGGDEAGAAASTDADGAVAAAGTDGRSGAPEHSLETAAPETTSPLFSLRNLPAGGSRDERRAVPAASAAAEGGEAAVAAMGGRKLQERPRGQQAEPLHGRPREWKRTSRGIQIRSWSSKRMPEEGDQAAGGGMSMVARRVAVSVSSLGSYHPTCILTSSSLSISLYV
jgi:hypothetical protein